MGSTGGEGMDTEGFLPVIPKSLKRSHAMISPPSAIPLRNRFNVPGFKEQENKEEDTNADEQHRHKERKHSTRVPPIVIRHPSNKQLVAEIKSMIGDNFSIKCNHHDPEEFKLKCSSIEHYRVIMQKLKEQPSIPYHTYATDDDKHFKVFLSGIVGFSTDEIQADLELKGVKAMKVVSYTTQKIKTGAFIVLLERGSSTIKDLKEKCRYVCHCCAGWAKFMKKKGEMVQCRRCQQFGHVAANCGHTYRCVKCTEIHQPGECPRTTREGPAKCVNCDGPHAANYRGCPAYKTYRHHRLQVSYQQRFGATQRRQREDVQQPTVQYVPAPMPLTNAWTQQRQLPQQAVPPPPTMAAAITPITPITTTSTSRPQVAPEEPQFCIDARILDQDPLFQDAMALASSWVQEIRKATTIEEKARILFLHRLTPEAMRRI
ncbi:hypothetical protein DMENIID0001_105550 [Sergentomyia squamirostris]